MLISISLQCRRGEPDSAATRRCDYASNFRTRHLHIVHEGGPTADVEDRNGNIQWDVDRKYRSFCKREFCLCNISAFRSISLRSLVSNEYLMMAEALAINR